ncbi:MAG: hypothetical protein Q4C73_03080 [Eubacteriales bacterium]|nr:hypothetical protein [Eubacteriales bacterium]
MDERELQWDDYIERDAKEFITLPEGDYDFTIEKFERARSKGGGKLPPCNMAIVYFTVKNPHGEDVSVKENYVLHTSMEWKLSELFRGVGQKQENERVQMNWGMLPGATGRCKLKIEEYKKDNETRTINRIDRLYPKESRKFEPGKF